MSILQIIGVSIIAALFIGMFMVIAAIDDFWTGLLAFGVTVGVLVVVSLGVVLASGALG